MPETSICHALYGGHAVHSTKIDGQCPITCWRLPGNRRGRSAPSRRIVLLAKRHRKPNRTGIRPHCEIQALTDLEYFLRPNPNRTSSGVFIGSALSPLDRCPERLL